MRCSVPSCNNDTKRTTKSDGITFHMFPKEQVLRTAWVEALSLSEWDPKDRSTVCSEHFRHEDFYETKCGLRKIKRSAVPDLNQGNMDLDAPAALRVCRVCLAIDSKMFHIKDNQLEQPYLQATGVTVSPSDHLPQSVCYECAARLADWRRFSARASTAQGLMADVVARGDYLTIRDVKTMTLEHKHLKSTLITKCYEPNDYDMWVKDNQVVVKADERRQEVDEDEDLKEDCDLISNEESVPMPPIMEVEIKYEQPNDIFYEEFPDNFESDDDIKLSEVQSEREAKKSEASAEKQTVKRTKKLKKKKIKVERKRVVKEKEKKEPKQDEDEDPNTTMDKYKKSDVKRRKTHDGLDESLFTITTLTYQEQIAEVERRQESAAYKAAAFRCSICYRGFLVRDRYDAHCVRHSEASGAYECFICKTRLKSARALRKHLTAQHTEQFSCKGCPFLTRNRGVAREHEKWHAGTKYQCPHCPSEFDKLTTYMGHIRIKHVSAFVCELCGYTFVSRKGIDVHKKKKHRLVDKAVTLEGPYCELCDVRFISEEAHDRHLKLSSKHSSDNDPNRIRNDSQSMHADRGNRNGRRSERRLAIHDRDGVSVERSSGPVTCEQCGVSLRDLRLYAQHFRRAHPDKNRTKYPAMKTPAMCEQCGRIFQSMALLKDHMWVHTGEKRFKCERCDKSFTQKTNLVFHQRVHSATRPTYECPLCGKHFAFFNNRRRHMFIHTGLKPFKCESCGKTFTTAGEQRAHVDHVHLKKPWPKRARAQRQSLSSQPMDAWQKCPAPPLED